MYFQAFYIFLSDSHGGCLRKSSRHLTGSYSRVIDLSKRNQTRHNEEKGQNKCIHTHIHTLIKGKQTKTKTGFQRDFLCPERGGHCPYPTWAASTDSLHVVPLVTVHRGRWEKRFSMTLNIIYLLFPQHF